MAYTTALLRTREAAYRRIDVAGRTAEANPAQLVQLLYEELCHALRAAAHAAENRNFTVRSDRVTRATAILFALESGLDFDNGGDLSKTLASLYASHRKQVIAASLGTDPTPFRRVADELEELATAWRQARAG
jgi:flagellar secretion chaperone FliS